MRSNGFAITQLLFVMSAQFGLASDRGTGGTLFQAHGDVLGRRVDLGGGGKIVPTHFGNRRIDTGQQRFRQFDRIPFAGGHPFLGRLA